MQCHFKTQKKKLKEKISLQFEENNKILFNPKISMKYNRPPSRFDF